jgi:hypothetical protein
MTKSKVLLTFNIIIIITQYFNLIFIQFNLNIIINNNNKEPSVIINNEIFVHKCKLMLIPSTTTK